MLLLRSGMRFGGLGLPLGRSAGEGNGRCRSLRHCRCGVRGRRWGLFNLECGPRPPDDSSNERDDQEGEADVLTVAAGRTGHNTGHFDEGRNDYRNVSRSTMLPAGNRSLVEAVRWGRDSKKSRTTARALDAVGLGSSL